MSLVRTGRPLRNKMECLLIEKLMNDDRASTSSTISVLKWAMWLRWNDRLKNNEHRIFKYIYTYIAVQVYITFHFLNFKLTASQAKTHSRNLVTLGWYWVLRWCESCTFLPTFSSIHYIMYQFQSSALACLLMRTCKKLCW